MTNKTLRGLRARIARTPANGRGYRQYDEALQRDVASHAAERQARGESYAAIAKDLRLPSATLLNWRGKEVARTRSKKRPMGFRPVALQPSERSESDAVESGRNARTTSSTKSEPTSRPIVVLPGRVRIEGLVVGDVAELVRSLGCLP